MNKCPRINKHKLEGVYNSRICPNCFGPASFEEQMRGYLEEEEHYLCLLCGKKVDKGRILSRERTCYEHAEEATCVPHIEAGTSIGYLCLCCVTFWVKRLTGLTDHQKNILGYFTKGRAIPRYKEEALGIGSASTVSGTTGLVLQGKRTPRPKCFLVLMELLKTSRQTGTAQDVTHLIAAVGWPKRSPKEDRLSKKEYWGNIFPGWRRTDALKSFPAKEKASALIIVRELAGVLNRSESTSWSKYR